MRADWLVAPRRRRQLYSSYAEHPFEGKTAPNQWIVIDIANDPLALRTFICAATRCDPTFPPRCPACAAEFMVMPGETEAQLSEPHNMRRLLSKVLPDPDRVELIRQRVYTRITPALPSAFALTGCCWPATRHTSCRSGRGRDTTAACATPSTGVEAGAGGQR